MNTAARPDRFAWLVFMAALLAGCAAGFKDFNKWDLNYDPFPTEHLYIGQPKADAVQVLGNRFKMIEASEEGEVLCWDRWVAVPGPDYVGERLLIRFRDGRLAKWMTTTDTVAIVPRSW